MWANYAQNCSTESIYRYLLREPFMVGLMREDFSACEKSEKVKEISRHTVI